MLQEAEETFQAYKENDVEQTDKVTAMVDITMPRLIVRGNSGTNNAETLTAAGCALAKMPVLIQG